MNLTKPFTIRLYLYYCLARLLTSGIKPAFPSLPGFLQWQIQKNRYFRLQRRDRHGFTPCSFCHSNHKMYNSDTKKEKPCQSLFFNDQQALAINLIFAVLLQTQNREQCHRCSQEHQNRLTNCHPLPEGPLQA